MALNDTGKNVMLDALAGAAGFVSLHTADPGTTGINEATGGAPAYARKAITWNAAATGSVTASNQPVFDVPAGTYTHVGFWSLVTAGTFYGSGDITDEVFAGQGTYTLTATTISVTG